MGTGRWLIPVSPWKSEVKRKQNLKTLKFELTRENEQDSVKTNKRTKYKNL